MQCQATVLSNTEVSPGYYRMRMAVPKALLAAIPGQFVMIKVRDAIDPLLRRPFGIFDMGMAASIIPEDPGHPYLEILYRVVGKGTAMLATLHHSDHIDILAPLGRGFASGDPGKDKILVGGGIGLAPLYYLAKELIVSSPVRLFIGGRTRDDVLCVTEFERLGVETYVATDDGSLGTAGTVTQVLEKQLTANKKESTIFACGPMPMLTAVAEIAAKTGIPCQVSLEAYMACGMGACLGCVVKGHDHSDTSPDYRCVCKEGPVFNVKELQWI